MSAGGVVGEGHAFAPGSVGAVLVGRLRELGVERVWGLPLGDLPHVPVADPDLAVLLADLDGRLGRPDGTGRSGVAHLAGGVLHLSSQPGGRAPLQSVGGPEELLDALADGAGLDRPATTALHLDLDLAAPAPDGLAVSTDAAPERVPVLTLDPSLAGLRLLVVAGPGVVRSGSIDGLHALTRAAGAPVLATWGAAGVERWDSPWHAGVGGLQARDLDLAGLADADVVITTGLDPDELRGTPLGAGGAPTVPVQEVPPRQLAVLCRGWAPGAAPPRCGAAGGRPSLRAALAPVLVAADEPVDGVLHPARAALHLAGALPDGGVAVADPGDAGLWVARAFPAGQPGSLCVPATVEPGAAAAAALVAAVERRPCLAVTDPDGAVAAATRALLDLARQLGLAVALQVWSPDGPSTTAAAHAEWCRAVAGGGAAAIAPAPGAADGCWPVGIDTSPAALVELAGAVTAWRAGWA